AAGSVGLVFNGEIYNHAEIRQELERLGKYQWRTDHSDTEVLLHAYEEWGLECVHRFYGMFAVAIYDARDPDRPPLPLIPGPPPDPRRHRHQAALLRQDPLGRMAVRLRDPGAAGPPRPAARDGPDGVLALPDLHRHARADDPVPRHLQATRRTPDDGRSHRP